MNSCINLGFRLPHKRQEMKEMLEKVPALLLLQLKAYSTTVRICKWNIFINKQEPVMSRSNDLFQYIHSMLHDPQPHWTATHSVTLWRKHECYFPPHLFTLRNSFSKLTIEVNLCCVSLDALTFISELLCDWKQFLKWKTNGCECSLLDWNLMTAQSIYLQRIYCHFQENSWDDTSFVTSC